MPSGAPSLFPGLDCKPQVLRHFLETTLRVRDLERLYQTARQCEAVPLCPAVLNLLDIRLRISPDDLARIPPDGPAIVVANHPFGLLDGLILDSILLRIRTDFRILTNSWLTNLPELQERCLPVDVFGNSKNNIGTLRRAIDLLSSGHALVFFPAGEVSHWQADKKCITDPEWSTAPVRCARHTDALIVPVYVSGANSLPFQLAGLIHPLLRTARLPGELFNKSGREVEVRIGTPLPASELKRFSSIHEATRYVRARTYALEHRAPVAPNHAGKLIGFPLLHNKILQSKPVAIAEPAPQDQITKEIERLRSRNTVILDTGDYTVFAAHTNQLGILLSEIGRLREATFRAAGEGTEKERDLDDFDSYYQHLLLWHKASTQIAGGYRLAWTSDVLPVRGIGGLYTSTLFRFHPQFFRFLGPAVELGRSFISPDFQKDYAPLLLLWQAIGRLVGHRPDAPVLFGPVSISAEYSQASRELIVRFVSRNSFRSDLARLVTPRHPFRTRFTSSADLRLIESCLDDLESLAAPLQDIGNTSGVPVLLRQYLRLGGKVAGFNLDRKFSNALDGLLVVDLRETAPKLLARYMGPELSAQFLAATRAAS